MPSIVPFGSRGTTPVTLAEVKAYLRVTDSAQDDVLSALIDSATDYAETVSGLTLRTQRFALNLDHFPYGNVQGVFSPYTQMDYREESPYYCGSSIVLPKYPVRLATSTTVSYINTSGNSTSLAYTTDFTVDYLSFPCRVLLPYNVYWPATRAVANAVTVIFYAGFDTTVDADGATGLEAGLAMPDGIKQAIKILVAHWYEHREPIIVGGNVGTVPMSVESLLWANRMVTL